MNEPAARSAPAAVARGPNDYKSDVKPVWCPGCGDFGVVNALAKAMAKLALEPKDLAVVSGIGCSGRIPGYTTAYGFNSVHGRALPIAQGIKLANPDLLVLVAGGDGDDVPPPPVERAHGGSVLRASTPWGVQHRSTEHRAVGGDASARGLAILGVWSNPLRSPNAAS